MADPRYRRAEHRAAARERRSHAQSAGVAKRKRYRAVPQPCPACDALSLKVSAFTPFGTPVMRCECGHEELLEGWDD